MATKDWVDERIRSLAAPGGWTPDAGRALTRLRDRNRVRGVVIRRWIWTTAAVAGIGMVMVLAPGSRACAEQPASCVQRMIAGVPAPQTFAMEPKVASAPSPNIAPAPSTVAQQFTPSSLKVKVDGNSSYKLTGSASAPILIEVYLDYDCPPCASFVREVVPSLNAAYIQAGRVALRYRDFPLPTHRYALLAARYANAAGELGYFDVAMRQIFDSRQAWDVDGDVDSRLAPVLAPAVMAAVRERLNDSFAAEAMAEDKMAGDTDHLDRTPFAVIVCGDLRQPVTDTPLSFEALKNRIDEMTEKKSCAL